MRKLVLAILVFVIPFISHAEEQINPNQVFEGKVTSVVSGDVVIVKSGDEQIGVRLAGIDSPDEEQPYGKISVDTLTKLILNKNVVVRDTGTDACGRVIGLVWLEGDNGLDISSRLVDAGATWVYRQYTNSKELLALEDRVKAKGLGLWSLPTDKRLPPWEWRKQAKFSGKLPKDACQNKNSDVATQSATADEASPF